MKDLESKNFLHSPPENISPITKREIKLSKNSAGLQQYISEIEAESPFLENTLLTMIGLFFLAFILRIYFRKKKNNIESSVKVS